MSEILLSIILDFTFLPHEYLVRAQFQRHVRDSFDIDLFADATLPQAKFIRA